VLRDQHNVLRNRYIITQYGVDIPHLHNSGYFYASRFLGLYELRVGKAGSWSVSSELCIMVTKSES